MSTAAATGPDGVDWDSMPRLLQELCEGHPGYVVAAYQLDRPGQSPAWLCRHCWIKAWVAAGRPEQRGTQ